MASRDHSVLFRRKRDGYRKFDRPRGGYQRGNGGEDDERLARRKLLNGDRGTGGPEAPRPIWVDIRDAVEDRFADLEKKLRTLRETQDEILIDTIGNRSEELNRTVDKLCGDVSSIVRGVNRKIRRLGRVEGVSPKEAKLRNAITMELSMRHRSFLKEFRSSRKEFMQKLLAVRGTEEDDLFGRSGTMSPLGEPSPSSRVPGGSSKSIEYDDVDIEANNGRSRRGNVLEQLQKEGNTEHDLLVERDRDIAKITKSITELADMFDEVNMIIVDQGTIMDRIDYNMDVVVEKSKKGVFELEKAEEHQKSNRALKCIAILVCMIIILTAIYAIKKG